MAPSTEVNEFQTAYEDFLDSDAGLHDLLEEVDGGDPRLALEAVGFLQHWLHEREDDLVLKGRVECMTWRELGRALGRSRQAVWERHRDPQDLDADED